MRQHLGTRRFANNSQKKLFVARTSTRTKKFLIIWPRTRSRLQMQIRVPFKLRCGTSRIFCIIRNLTITRQLLQLLSDIFHFSEHWPSLERLEGKGSRQLLINKKLDALSIIFNVLTENIRLNLHSLHFANYNKLCATKIT